MLLEEGAPAGCGGEGAGVRVNDTEAGPVLDRADTVGEGGVPAPVEAVGGRGNAVVFSDLDDGAQPVQGFAAVDDSFHRR